MFDPITEKPIPLAHVPKIKWLPCRRRGRNLHISTVFRWSNGLRGVKLETLQIGGTRCTSEQALRRFFSRLTDPKAPVPRSNGDRGRQKAEAELAGDGFEVGGEAGR